MASGPSSSAAENRKLFSQMQLLDFKEAFASLDHDGDAVISSTDLEQVIRSLGLKMTKRELEEMIRQVDENGDGEIEFDEFIAMMAKKAGSSLTVEEQCQETFRMLDVNHTGEIPVDKLYTVLAKMDPTLTKEDIDEMICEVDTDGSGTIDYEEFYRMMAPHV